MARWITAGEIVERIRREKAARQRKPAKRPDRTKPAKRSASHYQYQRDYKSMPGAPRVRRDSSW